MEPGRASRGNKGNYSFSDIEGRGNRDWRSGNRQQSGGSGTYNPPDGRICYYCREKGHIRIDCLERKERFEALVDLYSFEMNVNQDPCQICDKSGHTMMYCFKLKLTKVDQVKPGNAARVPDISHTPRDQHVYPGILGKGSNNKSVTVLRKHGVSSSCSTFKPGK